MTKKHKSRLTYIIGLVLLAILVTGCTPPQTITKNLPNSDYHVTIKGTLSDFSNRIDISLEIDNGSCSPDTISGVAANSTVIAICTVKKNTWTITMVTNSDVQILVTKITENT